MSKRRSKGQLGIAFIGWLIVFFLIVLGVVYVSESIGLAKTKTTIGVALEVDDRGSALAALGKADVDGVPVLETLGNAASGLGGTEQLEQRLGQVWGNGNFYRIQAGAEALTNSEQAPTKAGRYAMDIAVPGGRRTTASLEVWG